MRIESFWAKGFRSLRDVRLEGLGAFNVFYGPNGSGKSNILAAMDAWLRLVPIAFETSGMRPMFEQLSPLEALDRIRGQLALHGEDAPLGADDFAVHTPERLITLGGKLASGTTERAEIELQVEATPAMKPTLRCTSLEINGVAIEPRKSSTGNADLAIAFELERQILTAPLRQVQWGFSLVRADRSPHREAKRDLPPEGADPLSWYFRRGQFKDALFAAQNAISPETLRAFDQFREFMRGPPLKREPFRAVQEPHTGVPDLRERLPPPLDRHDIPLDLAGLGVAQIYAILAQAMLSGARMIGIEEPEAHLYAPTTGRHLRDLLRRLVDEKHVDQLFIATHSNLFDLDRKGYWDVSLKNGETVVERAELPDIDRKHLYEPGPTKHALQRMLEYMPGDEVVFRHGDGSRITATEMLRMLREDDEDAAKFLEDVHGAAMTMVKVGAKKKAAR